MCFNTFFLANIKKKSLYFLFYVYIYSLGSSGYAFSFMCFRAGILLISIITLHIEQHISLYFFKYGINMEENVLFTWQKVWLNKQLQGFMAHYDVKVVYTYLELLFQILNEELRSLCSQLTEAGISRGNLCWAIDSA